MKTENEKPALSVQSVPGRRHLFTRYIHPLTKYETRADLGVDPAQAAEICQDLSTILTLPQTWIGPDHRDLDGLHPKARDSFFSHPHRVINNARIKTRALEVELILKSIEIVKQKVELLWTVSSDRLEAVSRGMLSVDSGFDKKNIQPDEVVRRREYIYRFTCPDGSVLHVLTENCDEIWKQLRSKFGKTVGMTVFDQDKPDRQWLPELQALYGTPAGWFMVPAMSAKEVKAHTCLYRIVGPDKSVHFAYGCVAYENLWRSCSRKYKLPKCKITVESSDRIKNETRTELKKLYGSDNLSAIPTPDPPPKRERRQFPCPSCASVKNQILAGHGRTWQRRCKSCGHEYETPK